MNAQRHIHPAETAKLAVTGVYADANGRPIVRIDFDGKRARRADLFVAAVQLELSVEEACDLAARLIAEADRAVVDAEPRRLVAGEWYQVIPTGMCAEGFRVRATGEVRVGAGTTFHEMVGNGGRAIWVPDVEVIGLWSDYVGEEQQS